MEIIKTFNEVGRLYDRGLIQKDDSTFECPVCHKEYKSKVAGEKHVDKMDCYKMQDVFMDTEYEAMAHELYISVITNENPMARTGIRVFRKAKSYGPFLKFIIFTSYHQVSDKGLYYSWLNEIVGFRYTNKILSEGTNEGRLREYRLWLQRHPQYIDSQTFFERHAEALQNDQQFLIRSLEKSHIGIRYLMSAHGFDFDGVVDALDPGYYMRLQTLVEKV